MRNMGVYGLLVATAIVGCAGNDPTTLASGLDDPSALVVNGSTLFWINDSGQSDSSIQSIPITGGKVTTVLAQANLDKNLATDGTSLYFSSSPPSGTMTVISSCALDGSGVMALNSDLQVNGMGQNNITDLFVQGGSVYVGAISQTPVCVFDCGTALPINSDGPFIWSIPTGGGSAAIAVPMPASTTFVQVLGNFYGANSTGIYYSSISGDPQTGGASTNAIYTTALSGGAPTTLWSVAITATPIPPEPGGFTVVGSNALWLAGADNTLALMSVPITGGSATTVASYSDQASSYLTGDANGLFIDQQVQSSNPGFFSVTLSGVETDFVKSQLALSTSVGHERQMIVDSANVYWVAGGFNSGQGTVHAKAR